MFNRNTVVKRLRYDHIGKGCGWHIFSGKKYESAYNYCNKKTLDNVNPFKNVAVCPNVCLWASLHSEHRHWNPFKTLFWKEIYDHLHFYFLKYISFFLFFFLHLSKTECMCALSGSMHLTDFPDIWLWSSLYNSDSDCTHSLLYVYLHVLNISDFGQQVAT